MRLTSTLAFGLVSAIASIVLTAQSAYAWKPANCSQELRIKQALVHEAAEMSGYGAGSLSLVAEAELDLLETQRLCQIVTGAQYCEQKTKLLTRILADQRALFNRGLLTPAVLQNTEMRIAEHKAECAL